MTENKNTLKSKALRDKDRMNGIAEIKGVKCPKSLHAVVKPIFRAIIAAFDGR